jgi:membrane-associated phospholipid phosphatase
MNGLRVIDIERQANAFYELTIQQVVNQSHTLMVLTSFTYWNSEFTVVGLALLWVYLRRNEAFARFRNWLLTANVLGLLGYVVLPTAPPRMFPDFGFVDTLAGLGSLNHGSGLIELASNPYAAMPSLHAADALIVGISLAFVVRRWWAKALWLVWPAWVWFSLMATANHFLLDILAGLLVAAVTAAPFYARPIARRLRPSTA